ncbi:MAG: hypothetical protein R2761_02705 [Acidimicrobiales bacterium]
MTAANPTISRNSPNLASRIGRICSERDDGRRNYAVTLAYWDLSRLILAYTHALDTEDQAPGGEAEWIDLADRVIAQVLLANEPAATKPTGDGSDGNSMEAIIREAYDAYRPSAAVGAGPTVLNANFCTYATWSSLTLGRDIRNRLLPYRFSGLTSDTARALATRAVIRARRANNNELARQLGHGQRTVLWEVGLALLWLSRNDALLTGELQDDGECQEELQRAKPDGPVTLDDCTDRLVSAIDRDVGRLAIPQLRNEEYHQWRRQDLYLGLASYHLARVFARKAQKAASSGQRPGRGATADWHWKLASEMVLRGNIFIGAYEQHRVQTYLEYPLVDYGQEVLFEGESRAGLAGKEVALRRRISAQASRVFETRLNPLWHRFFTDQLLVIQMGDELLRLGKDLPIPNGQAAMFPEDLTDPTETWLCRLLLRYDHSLDPETGHGTQAHMWGDYDDRMSFIVNLMRSRAQLAGLWTAPFDPPDVARVRNGTIPNGG